MRKGYFLVPIIIVSLSLLIPIPIIGQEDTVHLVFTKRPRNETFVYQVKKSDSLIKIMKRELGITGNYQRYLREVILSYNPKLKNVDLIYPGQKIRLPLLGRNDPMAEKASPTTAPNLAVMKSVIERLGGTLSVSGQHVIPLTGAGQITLNCRITPVAVFPDGTVVIMDLHHRMDRDICTIIMESWPNYRIIAGLPSGNTFEFLARCINAVPGYRMMQVSKIPLGSQVTLTLPSIWFIKNHQKLLIHPASDQEQRFPPPVSYLLNKGAYELIEVSDTGEIYTTSPTPELPATDIPRLSSQDRRSLVTEILTLMSYEPQIMDEITIFRAEEDGFDVKVPIICLAEREGKFFAFTDRPLPSHFHRILRKRSTTVITVAGPGPREVIQQIAQGLRINTALNTYSFPIGPGSPGNRITINLPVLCLFDVSGRPLQVIDFDLDPRVYHYLSSTLGYRFVTY